MKKTTLLIPTSFQMSLLYGTLLGDSYLYTKGTIQIEQSEAHKEVVFWLYDQLKSLTTGKGPQVATRKRIHLKTGHITHTQSSRFDTRHLFREWKPVFYQEGVGLHGEPVDFSERLDAVALAIWFLDDGGRSSSVKTGVFLTVDSYTSFEITRIQETLENKFQIKTKKQKVRVSSSGNDQIGLAISGLDYLEFYRLGS